MGVNKGLTDTAVKTAQTGYVQNIFKLEDLNVAYDYSVRSSSGYSSIYIW